MLSSQQTPALSTPTSGFITPRGPWFIDGDVLFDGEAQRTGSAAEIEDRGGNIFLGSLSTGQRSSCRLNAGIGAPASLVADSRTRAITSATIDSILKEQQQHNKQCAPRSTLRSIKRAIAFGRLRKFLSRSRSASPSATSGKTTSWQGFSVKSGKPSCPREEAKKSTPLLPSPVKVEDPIKPATRHGRPRSGRVENFHRALDNEIICLAFERFCQRTLSSENMGFVRQVRVRVCFCMQKEKHQERCCRDLLSRHSRGKWLVFFFLRFYNRTAPYVLYPSFSCFLLVTVEERRTFSGAKAL